MKEVRFGIIGLGGISSRFAGALKTVRGVKLTHVAAHDLQRAESFARKFGAQQFSDHYNDVISDEKVDVVYIGLTHNFHYEFTKACLVNHKAVICEKPLTTNYRDARELVSLAEKNKTLMMEALWTRCMPAYRTAKKWVENGKIGKVKLVTANFNYHFPFDPEHRLYNTKLAGGALFDVGIYLIDFALGILDEFPKSITGETQLAPNGVDEADTISMKFESGALASLNCGFNAQASDEAWIYGARSRIRLNNCYGPRKSELFDEKGRRISVFRDLVRDGFEHEIRHCADLFRKGEVESPLIPWKDSLESARIFDLLRKQWGMF